MRAFKSFRMKYWANAHPFVRRLIEEAQRQQIGLQDLAERAGISYDALRNWTRSKPDIDTIQAALNAVGLELVVKYIPEDKQ